MFSFFRQRKEKDKEVEKSCDEMTPKLKNIENLLNQFSYSQNAKCGFLFFVGGSMLTIHSKEELEDLKISQNQITPFDINEEYEELLGPLRDLYIQDFFEELIWRLDTEIEPRKVSIPGTDVEVSEFNFENNKLLRDDDSKIEKLFDAENCLHALLEGIGEELTNHNYDLIRSYKAGMCFFNLKSQVDAQCTTEILKSVRQILTPTLGCIDQIAHSPTPLFEGYTNIQLALIALISRLDDEFSRTLWAFQSYVFYENQKEIPGIAEMPIDEFTAHCRARAIYFYNVNAEAIIHIANKQVHMSMFPPFQNGIDEQSSLRDAIKNTFGIPETNTFHSDINQKTLIVFSYFNVICETILSSPEKITIQ